MPAVTSPALPTSAEWLSTYGCNLRCSFCAARAGEAAADELDTDEALGLLDSLERVGVQELTISGGEFVTRTDWKQLLSTALERFGRVVLITNGFGGKPLAEQLELLPGCERLTIALSLDGGQTVHDDRRGSGSHRQALALLENRGAVQLKLITTVGQDNLGELPALERLCVEHGIGRWLIQPLLTLGRAAGGDAGRPVAPLLLHDRIRSLRDRLAPALQVTTVPFLGLLTGQRPRGDGHCCWSGRQVVVLPDGAVTRCVLKANPAAGNIRDHKLEEIWRSDAMARLGRDGERICERCLGAPEREAGGAQPAKPVTGRAARGVPRQGGARSLAFFNGLLGLGRGGRFRVESAVLASGRFELQVQREEQRVATLFVSEAQPGQPRFVGTDHLALVHQGRQILEELALVLQRHAFELHPELTFAGLVETFANDPDAWSPSPEAADDDPDTVSRRIEQKLSDSRHLVAAPDGFADFLGRYEILCQKVVSMWLFNPCTLIMHADSECFGPPNLGLNMVMTINAPWDNRLRDRGRPPTARRRAAEPRPQDLLVYVSDLRDRDVIFGSRGKEEQLFRRAFADDPGVVVFFHACVGVVAGSDIEDVFRRYKASHPMPVLYFRGGENLALRDFYTDVLVGVRKATPHPEGAPSNLVNLVGYSGHATQELLDGLAAIGVTVNGVLLPKVAVDPVVDFEKAALNVYLRNVDFDHFYYQLRQDSGITQHIEPAAPYGVAGTARWLRAVASATGRAAPAERVIAELEGAVRPDWDQLVARAHGMQITVAARDYEVGHFIDSKHTYGVPLLETLGEMGFTIEILLLTTEREITEHALAELQGHFAERVDLRLGSCETAEQLMEALAQSASRALFSGFFFDWRATSTGKSIISLQHFEAGFAGAVRTLRRLLKVCETPYYSKYRRFLQRDRFGRLVRAAGPTNGWRP